MESLDQIKSRIEPAVPGARLQIVPNDAPANQPSLLVDPGHALAIARFLRDDSQLRFDYASNVTGADWLDKVIKERVRVKKIVDGVEKEAEETIEKKTAGYLEDLRPLWNHL
jgi:NADH-quinone oxidoreductase subunit C